jgi:hypothetical protein
MSWRTSSKRYQRAIKALRETMYRIWLFIL